MLFISFFFCLLFSEFLIFSISSIFFLYIRIRVGRSPEVLVLVDENPPPFPISAHCIFQTYILSYILKYLRIHMTARQHEKENGIMP